MYSRRDEHIVITWSTDEHYSGIDQATVLVYSPENGQTAYDMAAGKRNTGTASIKIPHSLTSLEVHVDISL